MTGYLKRLVSSLAAYQLADVVSKLLAVLLLPVYTRYIAPAGYGVVELLANSVIFVSIVVRFGIIEAFLRFYFTDEDPLRRAALVRRAAGFLLLATTGAAILLAAFAEPLSSLLLGYRDTTTFLVAVLGLWSFTNLELAYGVLRVDERLRTYATASLINVVLTVAASVVLVVGLRDGARGLLLANYGASTVVLLGLWWTMRDRLRVGRGHAQRMGVLLRFGLPTVPAEASVYALSIVDRFYIYHHRSPALAGLYSIALKLAGAVAFIVRAFQYAWPPLAYSVTDDAQAARLYGLVTTYYVVVSGWVVAGLALLGRWVLRLLAAHEYFGRLPGSAVGGPGVGAVRAVGRVPGHRRSRAGDDAELPRLAGRSGRQHRSHPRPCPVRWGSPAPASRCAAPTGHAGGHVRAHPPRLQRRFRVGPPGPAGGGHGSAGHGRGPAAAHPRCRGLCDPGSGLPGHPRRAPGHRFRPRGRARSGQGPPAAGPAGLSAARGQRVMSRPAVSVVMPFAGSPAAGAEAVAALIALRIEADDELILADNSGHAPRSTRVRVVRVTGEQSPSHARNVGAEYAARDWILFLDADCQAVPDLLERYFAQPVSDQIGALAGEVARRPGGADLRGSLRGGAELSRPGGPPQPSLPASRRGRQPARPPRGLRGRGRLLRGRPRG